MDLLSQYRQDHPEAFQEKKPSPLTDEYGRTYTGMIAVVMRLSGGRIRDAKTASYALVGFIALMVMASLLSIFWDNDVPPVRSITTDDVLPR